MKYIDSLRNKYFQPLTPWWIVVPVTPLLVFCIAIERHQTILSAKLQPLFKKATIAKEIVIAMYKQAFPDTIEGFYVEMAIIASIAIATFVSMVT